MESIVSRWIKIILLVLVLASIVAFLMSIGDLVTIIIISGLLAYAFDPVVTQIESQGVGRTVSTVLLYFTLAIIIFLIGYFLIPLLITELGNSANDIKAIDSQFYIARLEAALKDLLKILGIENIGLTGKLSDELLKFSSSLLKNLLNMLTFFTYLLIIPFVVFFLLKDGRALKKYLISLVPNRYFELTGNLLTKMDAQLGNYLRGQFLDALIIGVLSIIALLILNVKYAVLIGALAGLANLVPYIGPIFGAILAMIFSFTEVRDLWLLLYIAIAFGIVQLIDNTIVQPAVVARNVNLPPLVVLLVVIIGGKFFGIIGMLLSVPVTAILKVFLQEGIKAYRQYNFS